MSQGKRLLILVGDFVEDYEAMVPFQLLLTVGHQVDAVCPDKRAGESVATAVHDFTGLQTYCEARGHDFRLNATFAEVATKNYDGLILPGGRAPEYLRLDERVLHLIQEFVNADKPIAAICHAAQLLTAAGAVAGKRMQAYPTLKPDILAAGGIWDEPSAALDSACADGNLVTAPAWPAHPAWMKLFLERLAATE